MSKTAAGVAAGVAFAVGVIVGYVARPRSDATASSARPAATVPQNAPAAAGATTFESLVEAANQAMDEKKYAEAVSAYDRALAIRFDANAATDRAICLKELGEHERALAAFEFVTLHDPKHWQARYNRAVVLLQVGRVAEARAEAERLLREHPSNASVQQLNQALKTR